MVWKRQRKANHSKLCECQCTRSTRRSLAPVKAGRFSKARWSYASARSRRTTMLRFVLLPTFAISLHLLNEKDEVREFAISEMERKSKRRREDSDYQALKEFINTKFYHPFRQLRLLALVYRTEEASTQMEKWNTQITCSLIPVHFHFNIKCK